MTCTLHPMRSSSHSFPQNGQKAQVKEGVRPKTAHLGASSQALLLPFFPTKRPKSPGERGSEAQDSAPWSVSSSPRHRSQCLQMRGSSGRLFSDRPNSEEKRPHPERTRMNTNARPDGAVKRSYRMRRELGSSGKTCEETRKWWKVAVNAPVSRQRGTAHAKGLEDSNIKLFVQFL